MSIYLTPRDFLCKKYLSPAKLDFIIFGASGNMGRRTVLKAVEVLKDFSWAIAGRDRQKLESVLEEIGRKSRVDLSDVPIFIADVEQPNTLLDLVIRCHVIVNCCGPYQWLGEPVIKACLEEGTHYVDLSMESHNTELMQLKYHDEAKRQNVYIISACGWESMPIDIGINFMQKNFGGTINYIESYVEYSTTDKSIVMPLGSSGTWRSLILACGNVSDIPAIREQFHTHELPDLKPKSNYRGPLHESEVVPGVCVPFPLIDQQVVESSQYYFYEQERKRPIQFSNYLTFPSYIMAALFCIWSVILSILAQLPITRNLLLNHPRIFSFGFFSDKGPSDRRTEKIHFKITLHAVGWERSVKQPTYEFEEMPTKTMTLTISGTNPLYGVSPLCLLSSAITIIDDCSKMPETGGVYSPGAAFAHTNIMDVLQKYEHGLTFEII